jgi:endonuclease/exonuclease/phosphatase family metal-dependent hydrolase
VNALSFLSWIFIDRKFSIIPLVAVAMSLFKLGLVLQPGWSFTSDAMPSPKKPNELRVVSFNVRVFDLYNWTEGDETRQRIFETIKELNPDVICFQEFFTSKHRENHNNIDAIKEVTGMPYYHTEISITKFSSDQFGLATFSKLPIIRKGKIQQQRKTTNLAMFTDVIAATGDTIRVYNCHLQSVRFKSADYDFIENPSKSEGTSNKFNKAFALLKLIKRAYSYRKEQAEAIAEHISSSSLPVVVCGDFNDPPISYSYKTISANLNDAFVERGRGIGATYAGPIPGLRIDYILYSDDFQIKSYITPKKRLSDHLPLVTDFEIIH